MRCANSKTAWRSYPQPPEGLKFGISIKLGTLLAAFGVLASGLTGSYTYHATRDILVRKASQDLLQPTQVLGRRFSILVGEVANDARFLAGMPRSHDIFGSGHAAAISRQNLSAEFKGLLDGAHAGLKQPTLQVAAPVMVRSW